MTDVPLTWPDIKEHIRKIALAVQAILEGKINSTGNVTLRASQTTTIVEDFRIGADTQIILTPTTANATAAMDNVYQSANVKHEITLTHDSNAATDRTFKYTLIG